MDSPAGLIWSWKVVTSFSMREVAQPLLKSGYGQYLVRLLDGGVR